MRPLIARQDELDQLGLALRRAADSRGGLVRIIGEPGIGKTSLADALATQARSQSVRVGWARAWKGSSPFALLVDAIRAAHRSADELTEALGAEGRALVGLLPEIARVAPGIPAASNLGSRESRERLLSALAAWIRRAEPMLWVLDDLHEADLASLEVLAWLATGLRSSRLLIVATERSVSRGSDADAEVLLARLPRLAETIALVGLDVGAVSLLLTERLGHAPDDELRDRVARATRGNPLFVEGMATALRAAAPMEPSQLGFALPLDLRHAIADRIRVLDAQAIRILEAGSLLNRPFSAALLAHLLDLELAAVVQALERAQREALVVNESQGYALRHPLIAEVLSAGIEPERRSRWHSQIAEAIERFQGAAVGASQLAYHRVRAVLCDGPEPALLACERAAQYARGVFAYEEAAQLYAQAAQIARQFVSGQPEVAANFEVQRAEALLEAGKRRAARQVLDEAWSDLVALAEPSSLAQAALLTAATGEFGAIDVVKFDRLEAALAVASDPATQARLMARLAAEQWVEPSASKARGELSERALELARGTGDRSLLAQVLDDRFQALFGSGLHEERRAVAEELVALAQQSGTVDDQLRACRRLMPAALEAGNLQRFTGEVERFAALVEPLQRPSLREDVLQRRQLAVLLQGRLSEALQWMEQTRTLGREVQNPQAEMGYRCVRAWLGLLRSEWGVLSELARALAEDVERLPNISFLRSYLALIHAACGERVEAERHLGFYLENWLPRFPADLVRVTSLAFAAECAARLGKQPACAALLEALTPYGDQFVTVGSTLCFGSVRYYLGLLHHARGEHSQAALQLSQAHTLHEESGSPTLCWLTLRALRAVLHEQPSPEAETRRDAVETALARLAEQLELDVSSAAPPFHSAALEPRVTSVTARLALGAGAMAALMRDAAGWQLVWGERSVRVRETKGLAIVAQLLMHPAQGFHVLDLMGAGQLRGGLTNDAPPLDAQALQAYRRRMNDLRQQLEGANDLGDGEAANRARMELETLEDELASALGLGRRTRASGPVERARSAVAKSVSRALAQIAEVEPAAASHLGRSVRTGVFCSYDPDPASPISWRVTL